MTKITLAQRKDIIRLLDRPVRYGKNRLRLSEYIKNTAYRHIDSFENALIKEGVIKTITLKAENGKTETLYSSTPDLSAYEVAIGLCPDGYFCNLTSLYFHGLTNQIPKTIYMARENIRDYPERMNSALLTDHDIFSNFIKKPRVSRCVFKFEQFSIVLTERVNRKNVGVNTVSVSKSICPKESRVTSIERGLIDAIVHPQYNGGIGSVVEFYRVGVKRINVNKLLQIYKALDFKYPYWQAIGFVCEKVGAISAANKIAEYFRPSNKFYIDHSAKDSWILDVKWQIYYPEGLFCDHNRNT